MLVAVFDTGEHVGGLCDAAATGLLRREIERELALHLSVETEARPVAGDAGADRPVLHEAADEGWIAGRNAARYPDVRPTPRGVAFALTYTDPGIAVVGPPASSLDRADLATGWADLSRSGRARVMGRDVGLILIHARASDGLLVGGDIVGPQAEHLGHLLAWAVQLGLTAERALDLPFYHPTLEESLRTALRDLCGSLKRHPARSGQEVGPGC